MNKHVQYERAREGGREAQNSAAVLLQTESVPGVYVVSGVGYWNRDEPRRWDADGVPCLQSLFHISM